MEEQHPQEEGNRETTHKVVELRSINIHVAAELAQQAARVGITQIGLISRHGAGVRKLVVTGQLHILWTCQDVQTQNQSVKRRSGRKLRGEDTIVGTRDFQAGDHSSRWTLTTC